MLSHLQNVIVECRLKHRDQVEHVPCLVDQLDDHRLLTLDHNQRTCGHVEVVVLVGLRELDLLHLFLERTYVV